MYVRVVREGSGGAGTAQPSPVLLDDEQLVVGGAVGGAGGAGARGAPELAILPVEVLPAFVQRSASINAAAGHNAEERRHKF